MFFSINYIIKYYEETPERPLWGLLPYRPVLMAYGSAFATTFTSMVSYVWVNYHYSYDPVIVYLLKDDILIKLTNDTSIVDIFYTNISFIKERFI